MKNYPLKIFVVFVVVFLTLGASSKAYSQFSNICDQAQPICDVSTIEGNMFTLIDPAVYERIPDRLEQIPTCQGQSNGFQLQNPYWLFFTATNEQISFDIEALTCDLADRGNNGFQFAILENCDDLTVRACNADQNETSVVFTETGFIEGQEYYLVVDGFEGSICDMIIRNINGIGTSDAGLLGDIVIDGFLNDTICLGLTDVRVAVPSASGVNLAPYSFDWEIINREDGLTILDTTTIGNSIQLDFLQAGDFIIETEGYNACSSTNISRKNINVYEIEDEYLDEFTFCLEELSSGLTPSDPDFMGMTTINSIAVNPAQFDIIDDEGCMYSQFVPLNPIIPGARTVIDTFVCGSSLTIYGETFTEDVQAFPIDLVGASSAGCDSLLSLNVSFFNIEGLVTGFYCDGGYFIELTIQDSNIDITMLDDYELVWSGPTSNIISDTEKDFRINISENGEYRVQFVAVQRPTTCTSEVFQITVNESFNETSLNLGCEIDINDDLSLFWSEVENVAYYAIVLDQDTIIRVSNFEWVKNDIQAGENIQYSLVAIFENGCNPIIATATCENNLCPNVILTLSGPTELCESELADQIQFNANVDTGSNTEEGTGTWVGDFVNQNGILDIQSDTIGLIAIGYEYVMEDCIYSDTWEVEIFENPSVEIETFSSNCEENSSFVTWNQNQNIEVYREGNIVNSDSVFINTDEIGDEIVLQFVDINTGCSITEMVTINSQSNELSINGEDQFSSIMRSSFELLNSSKGSISEIEWTFNDAYICDLNCDSNIELEVMESGVLCAIGRFDDGCDFDICRNISLVLALEKPFIPNVFEPIEGNVNTYFAPQIFQAGVRISSFNVYDRWGNMVYSNIENQLDEPAEGWSGTYEGSELPTGVYFYTLRIVDGTDQSSVYKGDVALIR